MTTLTPEQEEMMNAEREAMAYDVLIVGAGPAGLAAAIKVKQLCETTGKNLSVCVVEKAPELGAHILSGIVHQALITHH